MSESKKVVIEASYKRRRAIEIRIFIVSFFIFLIALSFYFWRTKHPKKITIWEKSIIRVKADKEIENEIVALVQKFQKENPNINLVYSETNENTTINTNPIKQKFQAEIYSLPDLILKSGNSEKNLRLPKKYWLASDMDDDNVKKLGNFLKDNLGTNEQDISLTTVGDIIPGRTVAQKMAQNGTAYPFDNIAPYVTGADIVYGNLECPLSDRINPPYEGMNFIAPSKTIDGIKKCGINIVSLANNHSTNFGENTFLDTLDLLKTNDIKYFGGGKDLAEATSAQIFETKGKKIAFLNYNSVIGSMNAQADSPGVSWINMQPWSQDDPSDIKKVQDAVVLAKLKSDLVVVCFHWGKEYEQIPIDSQRNMAHAACDAGADLIIGTHPHCIQAVEAYNGKFIAYSLGNFVFDQMWSEQTTLGIIAKYQFKGKNLTKIELLPYKIADYSQPNILEGADAQKVTDNLFQISGM